MIGLRKETPVLRRSTFATGASVEGLDLPDQAWFQADGQPVSDATWADPNARSLGLRLVGPDGCVLVLFNAYWDDVEFVLPPTSARGAGTWRCLLNTHANPDPDGAEIAAGAPYALTARSLAVLGAR